MPTITAAPEPSAQPPAVLVTVDWPGAATVTITRSDPDGRERPLRGAEPAVLDADGHWEGWDYEAWFGANHVYSAGLGPLSASSAPVRLETGAMWLHHPADPALSMPVDLYGDGDPIRAITRAVLQPMRRRTPIVVTDVVRRSPGGITYGVRTWSLEEKARLVDLLDDGSPLLLRVPVELRYGLSYVWISVGDVQESRLIEEWAPFEGRLFSLPCDVVDRPTGDFRAKPSFDDVQDPFATYAAWLTAFADWQGLLDYDISTRTLIRGD